MTHNKKQITLLNLLINCISARLVPKTMSTRNEYTFDLWTFRIIGLRIYSANSWFDIISFSIPPLEIFLLKNL